MEEFLILQKTYLAEFKKFSHECFEIIKKYKLSDAILKKENISNFEDHDKYITVWFEWDSCGEERLEEVTVPKVFFSKNVDVEYNMYLDLKSKFEG